MSLLLKVLLVGLCYVRVKTVLPPGYILEVTSQCGTLDARGGNVTIVTDVLIEVTAECAGSIIPVATRDNVHFLLPMGYPEVGAQTCILKTADDVYEMKVKVSFQPIDNMPQHEDHVYNVRCTFDPSSPGGLGVGTITPVESASEEPSLTGEQTLTLSELESPPDGATLVEQVPTSPHISLRVVDGWGEDLAGQRISIGKRAMLRAELEGAGPEFKGLRPVSCDAIGRGERYSIIHHGCGDGIVFSKTAGFTTDGLVASSPYFDSFRFHDGDDVLFECNFTLCTSDCNGPSCQPSSISRDRREGEQTKERMEVVRTKIFVEVAPQNTTDDKIVFVKSAKNAVTRNVFTNPYFLIPVVVLSALALVSCLVAACACAKRDSAQIYEVNKQMRFLESCFPTVAKPKRKQVGRTYDPKRFSTSVADCRKFDSLYKNPWDTELCTGRCTKPCEIHFGGRCDPSCTNVCNK